MKVKLSQYAKMTGVSLRTLWRRIKDGSLQVERTDTGRVFIEVDVADIKRIEDELYHRLSILRNLKTNN